MDPLVQAAGGAGRGGGQEGVVNGPGGEHAGEHNEGAAALRRLDLNKEGISRCPLPVYSSAMSVDVTGCRQPPNRTPAACSAPVSCAGGERRPSLARHRKRWPVLADGRQRRTW